MTEPQGHNAIHLLALRWVERRTFEQSAKLGESRQSSLLACIHDSNSEIGRRRCTFLNCSRGLIHVEYHSERCDCVQGVSIRNSSRIVPWHKSQFLIDMRYQMSVNMLIRVRILNHYHNSGEYLYPQWDQPPWTLWMLGHATS